MPVTNNGGERGCKRPKASGIRLESLVDDRSVVWWATFRELEARWSKWRDDSLEIKEEGEGEEEEEEEEGNFRTNDPDGFWF